MCACEAKIPATDYLSSAIQQAEIYLDCLATAQTQPMTKPLPSCTCLAAYLALAEYHWNGPYTLDKPFHKAGTMCAPLTITVTVTGLRVCHPYPPLNFHLY